MISCIYYSFNLKSYKLAVSFSIKSLKKSLTDVSNDKISLVIKFIRENLTEDLSIELLSEKAYMSASYFYRTFKHELGSSPNDFIIEERLKVAESLLRNPRMSVKEAYLASGFNSFSYFCRIFKKRRTCHRLNLRRNLIFLAKLLSIHLFFYYY